MGGVLCHPQNYRASDPASSVLHEFISLGWPEIQREASANDIGFPQRVHDEMQGYVHRLSFLQKSQCFQAPGTGSLLTLSPALQLRHPFFLVSILLGFASPIHAPRSSITAGDSVSHLTRWLLYTLAGSLAGRATTKSPARTTAWRSYAHPDGARTPPGHASAVNSR